MTTTTIPGAATTETESFARLAPKLIDPDPENRTASIDAEFRKSVEQHGVLEPVLVVPHPDADGRYLLVAGERRWRAATAVGCVDIPAVIDSGLSATDRVVRQITENLHRLDVAPAAEAKQFMRLATLGMSVRDLATQLGRTQRYVRDRLKIAELPRPAQKLVDSRHWTIEDGLAATRLLDHPDQLADLVDAGHGNISWNVDRIVADLFREAAVAAMVEDALAEGKRMVLDDGDAVELTALGIDETDHATEECHGYVVKAPSFGDPSLVPVCVDRKNHAKRGKSDVKAVPSPKSNPLDETEAAERKAKREADTERIAAIAAGVAGKVTKAEVSDLIARTVLDSVSADDAKKAAKVLGIEGDKDTYWPTAVSEHAAASDAALQRTALAIALVVGNRHIHNGWSDPRQLGVRVAEFLKARGWKPSAHDRTRLKTLKTNTK